MKTAISLPDPLYRSGDRLAKRLGLSRSELYARALAEFLAKHQDDQITQRLNAVYAVEDGRLDPAFAKAQLAAGVKLPAGGAAFISVSNHDKPAVVQIVLENDAYLGRVHWRGDSYPGLHEPLIEEHIFQAAQALLRELDRIRPTVIPANVNVNVTRNDGAKANDAVNTLMEHLAIAIATVVLLLVIFSELAPNYRVRVVLISSTLSLLFVRIAFELRRDVPTACRSSCRFTELVMWAVAAMTVARAASTIVEQSSDLLAPGVLRSSTFLLYTGITTAATLGVMWIEIQRLELDLIRSARIDALTGVLNRGAFLEEFGREVSRSEREGTVFSLAIFDLDNFKRLNDRYGHPEGDRALKSVVETMRATIRRHDLLGRYGGEEFALLMPNTGKETAIRVAERVRGEIDLAGFRVGGERVGLTVSGGVATFQLDGFDWDSLLIAADNALYAAKETGRNRIVAAGSEAPTDAG